MVETGGGGGLEVVDVAEMARAVDCVDECDRHQSCRAVDINETARSPVSCRFYLATTDDKTLESTSAPGVVQFIARRCPEDGERLGSLVVRALTCNSMVAWAALEEGRAESNCPLCPCLCPSPPSCPQAKCCFCAL